MSNIDCYSLEIINFKNGIFDRSIDATYIIHLLNNGRYDSIKDQLYKIKLTKKNYILINKGYKNCTKILNEQKPYSDLVDCYLTIFENAKEKNYDNILILEDDFLLDNNLLNKNNINNINNINNFLINNKNNNIVYSFGILPFIVIPYDYYNYKVLFSSGTHSMVYTKKMRNNTLLMDRIKIKDWEIFTHKYANKIMYNTPLCYQLFTITENSSSWKDYYFYGINISKIWNNSIRNMYDYFHLDKDTKSYLYFYFFSKFVGIFIIIIVVLLLYFLIYFLFKKEVLTNKKKNKRNIM